MDKAINNSSRGGIDGMLSPNPEEDVDKGNDQEFNDLMALYEESLKDLDEGKIVRGKIIKVDEEYVLVDIGYKSEGQIPVSEFVDSEGNVKAEAGDEVDIVLVRKENEEGVVTLSREKASVLKVWDDIQEAFEKEKTVKGRIIGQVKGGFTVDIGVEAFLPRSQFDITPVRDPNAVLRTEHDFRIIKYDKRHKNIVLSRRVLLEAERMVLREKTFELLQEGAILEGVVKNITAYGIFVDLGGIDGLVHITDLSWSRVGHPSEIYQVGDQVSVKVLHFDREKEKVSLGIKQLKPDPWGEAEKKYPEGAVISGRVTSLKDYGAFVELEEGLTGLVHVSDLSWTKKVKHPSHILTVGDSVDVMVLKVDLEKKRISLGLKQLEPNPWDVVSEKFPVGTIIQGRIRHIADFGIFIGIDEGIDGLVHVSDFSWTKRISHPSELYKKGQEVQAVVLNIDRENERFSLGIKQLAPDPWDWIPEKYKRGSLVTGTVSSLAEFGVFVELEEGVEGLIHVSELPDGKGQDPASAFEVGRIVRAKVINVSREDRKIGLSVRKLDQEDSYLSYVNHETPVTSNLGDLLKEELGILREKAGAKGEEDPGEGSSGESSPGNSGSR